MPIYNGGIWIDQCFNAILKQTAIDKIKIEVCVCNDGSTDDTKQRLDKWINKLRETNIDMIVFENNSGAPKGGNLKLLILHIYNSTRTSRWREKYAQ